MLSQEFVISAQYTSLIYDPYIARAHRCSDIAYPVRVEHNIIRVARARVYLLSVTVLHEMYNTRGCRAKSADIRGVGRTNGAANSE